jgi:hypothetical protein
MNKILLVEDNSQFREGANKYFNSSEQIHGFGLGGKKELCEFKKSWWYC